MQNEIEPVSGEKKTIKPTTAWIIIAVATLILFGGALAWAYYTEPNDYDFSNGGTLAQQQTETTTADETADWKTYTNNTYGFSFKYPKDWYIKESASDSRVYVRNVDQDVTKENAPSNFQQVWISYGIVESAISTEDKAKNGSPNGVEISGDVASSTITSGDIIMNIYQYTTVGGNAIEAYWQNSTGQRYSARVSTESGASNQNSEVIILKQILSTFQFIASNTASTTSTTNISSAWKTYENTDYGFGLTFTDAWEGYKVKAVDLAGTVKTFYINVPTTDPNYATETDMSYAGYDAPFAISVINKSDWQDDEIFARDFGSKVGEKGDYIFTSSSWQACPTDLCDGDITSSLKTVMDSFKVL